MRYLLLSGLLVLSALLPIALPVATAVATVIEIPKSSQDRPKLKSIYGVTHGVSELKDAQTRVMVFIFTDVDCPVAQLYQPRLKEMYADYADQGVKFFAIYPNARTEIPEMAKHAHDQDLPYPAFSDTDHLLADLLDAEVTPEVVVLNADWDKKYQGAIDNQFKRQGRRGTASVHYLRDAIEQTLNGHTPSIQSMPPSGCPIERMKKLPPRAGLTYHRDIAPLMREHCQECHRDGGVGPFELMTYEDAYYSAERIAENVVERRMPPWHGFLNPKYGKLRHDAMLTDAEIQTIRDWVRSGAAEGDPADSPPEKVWPDSASWAIGTPDYIYATEGFLVPKTGILDYQFFRVKLNFEEDRWFRAVEVKPGSTEVVHHVGLHVVPSSDTEKDYTTFSGMADLYGLNTEGAILINDYVPGDTYNAKKYPPGQAVRIPKNSDLIFEVHYTPNHREEVFDKSSVGFIWADGAPADEVYTKVFRKPIGRFNIPPHTGHHTMLDTCYFEHDVLIDAIRPHFHYRGKSFRLERITRDPKTDKIVKRETILSVPVWDPDWQRTYELETPLWLPAGTELLATGVFDNSYLNPNNPDPSATVQYGQQSSDEMFSVRYKFRHAQPATKNTKGESTQ